MSPTLLLLLRLAVLGVLFLVCLRLERRRRGVVVVLLLVGVVLLDATLYSNSAAAAVQSIFHPRFFGQNFRITQLLIPLAVLARLIARGLPRRMDGSALFWVAFFAWILAEAVVGLLAGHTRQYVLGEASVVIHLGGAMLLAAGVPAEDYVNDRAVTRFLQGAAVFATALFVLDTLGVRWSNNVVPDLPLVSLGSYAADAATLFSSVGVLALVLGLAGPKHLGRRALLLLPAAVLILSHVASSQRAARLGLYVTLLVLLVVGCLPTARRRLPISLGQVGFAAATVAVLGFAAVFVPAVAGVAAPDSAVASPNAEQFAPTSRQGSIQSRFNQWDVVLDQIRERPLAGEGLGGTFVSYSEGEDAFVQGDISHNIVLDLLRRTGVVGLVLGVCALLAVWAQAVGVWRFHRNNQVACLAVGTIAVTAGLLAKGMVESIFEKDRLAVFLGVVLGIAISTFLSRDSATPIRGAHDGGRVAPTHASASR
jgi:O-Antigen ligase